MKIINLKEPKWADMRDALNVALYHAQCDGEEKGAVKVRASLKLKANLVTGNVDWAVAVDDGMGDMETVVTGSVRA